MPKSCLLLIMTVWQQPTDCGEVSTTLGRESEEGQQCRTWRVWDSMQVMVGTFTESWSCPGSCILVVGKLTCNSNSLVKFTSHHSCIGLGRDSLRECDKCVGITIGQQYHPIDWLSYLSSYLVDILSVIHAQLSSPRALGGRSSTMSISEWGLEMYCGIYGRAWLRKSPIKISMQMELNEWQINNIVRPWFLVEHGNMVELMKVEWKIGLAKDASPCSN